MKPNCPCTKDCPKRKPGCRNREVCPDWGIYEDEYKARCAAVDAAVAARDAFVDVRRGAARRSNYRRQANARKRDSTHRTDGA